MRLRSLLASAAAGAALIAGALTIAPAAAFASTNMPPSGGPQCQQTCTPPDGGTHCHPVATPGELNLSWVTNNTGETVTVTLTGKYYWIQTSDPKNYYPVTTTEVILAPGESISVAWHWNTGPHSWCWTGKDICVTAAVPCSDPHGYLATDSWGGNPYTSCLPCKAPPVPCKIRVPDPCKDQAPLPCKNGPRYRVA
jgi:hypothetical protein